MNRKQRRKSSKKKPKKSSTPTLSQEEARVLFDTAADKTIAGDLEGATTDLKKLLDTYPTHPRSLYLMGRIAYLKNDTDTALKFLEQAANTPNFAEPLCDIGVIHRAAGRLDEASASYRKALAINPDIPEVNANLGNTLRELGQLEEAAEYYTKALKLKPDFSEALHNFGITLTHLNKPKEAAEAIRKSLQLNSNNAPAYCDLGHAYWKLERSPEATECFTRALEIEPEYAAAHTNMAAVYFKNNQPEDAIISARKAIALNPNDPASFNTLGGALHQLGDIEEGFEYMAQGAAINPDNAETRFNMGISLLIRGKFEEGWPEFEYRLKNKLLKLNRGFKQPIWQGEDLGDKTLLLYSEQGLGDTVQFARYIPQVKAKAPNVIFEVEGKLVEILHPLTAGIPILVKGKQRLPDFDVYAPLASLPGIFKTTLETIPTDIPYLFADPARIKWWRDRLAGTGLKVGLAWGGNPEHSNDRNRSMPLEAVRPLLSLKGIRWFSLQIGERAQDLRADWASPIEDLSHEVNTFPETAAAMMNLDLIISVDTSLAHLAGALGRRVWMPLGHVADWRWLRDRNDSPWYPTAHLFRQRSRGGWGGVIEQIRDALLGLD
jgi:Flp pilus assembly protein TadD